jgi:hypothetical protein
LLPVDSHDRAAAFAGGRRPIVGPRVHFEPTLPLGAPVPKDLVRPPAFEIPAAPHAHPLHVRKFESAIYPAAATPFRRTDVPIRVIIERNKHERFGHPTHPERGKMMEIPGAINKKPRKLAADIVIEVFNQSRRRGETERRPPERGVQRLDSECVGRPGLIQIEMKCLGQELNVAAERTNATVQFLFDARILDSKREARCHGEEQKLENDVLMAMLNVSRSTLHNVGRDSPRARPAFMRLLSSCSYGFVPFFVS